MTDDRKRNQQNQNESQDYGEKGGRSNQDWQDQSQDQGFGNMDEYSETEQPTNE